MYTDSTIYGYFKVLRIIYDRVFAGTFDDTFDLSLRADKLS